MPARDSRSRSSSPYAVEQMAVTFHRSAFGAWWRWRTELSAFTVLAASYCCGWWQLGSWLWPLLVLAVLVVVLVAVPGTRRLAADRFWVLFTRHRPQRSFWELRLHTRAGRLPLVPWITATPVGVRAWVLLRAGMTFADFEDSAAAFASACGARDCRVTASARWAWLLAVDIIRRDALGPRRIVTSPLTALPAIDPDEFPAWPEPAAAEDWP